MTIGQAITPMIGILILAAVVEALVEYLGEPVVGWIYKQFAPDRTVPESLPILRYVSAAVGVAVCIAYNADLLATMGVITSVPYVGPVITGLLIGRGANFINDFVSRWRE